MGIRVVRLGGPCGAGAGLRIGIARRAPRLPLEAGYATTEAKFAGVSPHRRARGVRA